MLDIQIKIEGDRVIIDGLNKLAAEMPKTIDRGLARVAKGIHGEAHAWLSGAGGASKKVRTDYVGFIKKSGEKAMFRSYAGAGGYPVPVRTRNLRRMLDWLKPGESKQGEAGTFTAGPHEVVIYDSAEYANVIHEGKGSSAKFGPRRYLIDALEKFNQGARIASILQEEIVAEIAKKGMK